MQDKKHTNKRWSISVATMIHEEEEMGKNKVSELQQQSRPSGLRLHRISASSLMHIEPSKTPVMPSPAPSTSNTDKSRRQHIKTINKSQQVRCISNIIDSKLLHRDTLSSSEIPILYSFQPLLTVSDEIYQLEQLNREKELKCLVPYETPERVVLESFAPIPYVPSSPLRNDPFLLRLQSIDSICSKIAENELHRHVAARHTWSTSTLPLSSRTTSVQAKLEKEKRERELRLQAFAQSTGRSIISKAVETAQIRLMERKKQTKEMIHSFTIKDSICGISKIVADVAADLPMSDNDDDKKKECNSENTPDFFPPSLLSIPSASLINAVNELLTASNSKNVLGKFYGDVHQVIWQLQGILNRICGGNDSEREAMEIQKCVSGCANNNIQAILRAVVIERMIRKASEISEKSVCAGIASVCVALMCLDTHYVTMVYGVLYRFSQFFIPSIPVQSVMSDKQFEKEVKRIAMLVYFICCLSTSSKEQMKSSFSLLHSWYWIVTISKLAYQNPFLQYAAIIEPFFSAIGGVLKRQNPSAFGKLITFVEKEVIPKLDKIDGKTSGQIFRLSMVLDSMRS